MKSTIIKRVAVCVLLGCAALFAGAQEVRKFQEMENPARWSKNAAAGKVQITFDKKEKAVVFQETFAPKVDRWIYPQYRLQLPQESLKRARTFSFEWKVDTDKPLREALVMVLLNNGKKCVYLPIPRKTGTWVKCKVDLTQKGINPATITHIRIGLNPSTETIRYSVRNIQFTFDKAPVLHPVTFKDMENPARWNRNAAAGKVQITFNQKEKALVIEETFAPKVDRWIYPRYSFRKPQESLKNVKEFSFEWKVETEKPLREALVMILAADKKGKLQHYTFPVPKKTGAWVKCKVELEREGLDPDKIACIQIGVNPTCDKVRYMIRNMRFFFDRLPPTLTAKAVATVYFVDDKLDFQGTPHLKWSLADWRGTRLREGVFGKDGKLRLAPLPSGYYTLTIHGKDQKLDRTFAVVPHRPAAKRNPNMYYTFDTALSWMNTPRAVTAEAAYRSGVTHVRDRLSWGGCEKIAGKYDFNYYLNATNELKKRNVAISGMFHDAPARLRQGRSIPVDLLSIYKFCRKLSTTFGDRMTDWEFWNEQDIGFAKEGAWDYASAMKAAYLGFKAGNKNMPVAIGGIAQIQLPTYCDVMFENGLKEYIDILNMHTYQAIPTYPGHFDNIYRFMKKHGLEQRPLWFTEVGTFAEGSGRIQEAGRPNKAHDRDQELIVAEVLTKQMLTMQFYGTDRCFWFILPAYYETGGAKVWGLMRDDYSVKPGYCAFAGLAENLGFAKMEGEVHIGKGLKAYLFKQPDGKQTLVYWQISELEKEGDRANRKFIEPAARTFQLKASAGIYKGTTIFSTPFTVKSVNGILTLKAERFINYIHGLSGIKVSKPAVKRTLKMTAANIREDRTVIYQVIPGKMFKLMDGKEAVDLKEKNGSIELVIWNLSPEVKRGNIVISGCKAEKIPAKVEIKPFNKTVIPLTITPQFKEGRAKFAVSGKFNGKETTPLIMPVVNQEKMIASARIVKKFQQMEDPANWKKNAAGEMTIGYDDKESAVVFQGTFPPRIDRWIYPKYTLQLPQDSLKGAKFISFEMKIETEKPLSLALLMCSTKGKNGNKTAFLHISKETGKWVKNVVSLNQQNIDPDEIVEFQIGVNPRTDKIRYAVRNFSILY